MRNILIKIAYGIGVFIATVLITAAVTGTHGTATTEAMARATLPVVTFLRDGETQFNELHGYTTAREPGSYRGPLTPITDDRTINLQVDPYGQQVTRISYEVRDITGERLIDSQDVTGLYVLDGGVTRATFTIGNLLNQDTEYLLVLRISTTNVSEVLFYSRIIYASESTISEGDLEYNRVLDFVDELHGKTFEKDNRSDLATYLYLDSGSGTNYSVVANGSSYEEITWGDMSPVIVSDPIWTITDLQENVYGVTGTYIIEITDTEEETTVRCDVAESYRLYEGSDRFHVLGYNRVTDQIYDAASGNYTSDSIVLGITGSGVTSIKSENGDYAAIVEDNRLYLCAVDDNAISYVFGYAEADSLDRRDIYQDSDIKVLRVDDDGNVDFIVYGYMNRGSHEGTVGVAAYHYDSAQRAIEERAYVPYTGSAELLAAQVDSGSYLSGTGMLYLLLGEDLIRINTETAEATVLQSDLQERDAAVSESGEYIAWREETSIILTDLEDLSRRTIAVSAGETGIPLGFMGEDLVYGIARDSDEDTSQTDTTLRLMYTLRIVNSALEELENYTPSGYYISDCIIAEGQIMIRRMEQITDESGARYYVSATDDQIMSGVSQNAASSGVSTSTDSLLGRVTSVAVKGFDGDAGRYYRPNEILDEGDRNVTLAVSTEESLPRYVVYDYEGLSLLTYNAREAVLAAEDVAGTVVDDAGRLVWASQIRSVAEIEDTTNIDGKDVATAFADAAGDNPTLTLTGLPLDNILYYISLYHPVLARTNSTEMLLLGYSDRSIVAYDPTQGGRVVLTRSEATILFQNAGSQFTVYY